MTDQIVEPDVDPADGAKPPVEDQPLGEGGKKALESERAARKEAEKAASEYKARLDGIEAEKLTDLEKVQNSANEWKTKFEAAETARTEAELSAQRTVFAGSKGIPVSALTGSQEQWEQQAADLIAWRDGTNRKQIPAFKSGAAKPESGMTDKERAVAALRQAHSN